MSIQILESKEDVEDFALGCTFFGTGGGGTYEAGISYLTKVREEGHTLSWVGASQLGDDQMSASVFGMGSIAPKSEEFYSLIKDFGAALPKDDIEARLTRMSLALLNLERHIGSKIDVLVAGEIGGGNACACVALAARLGKVSVDGDYAGRALPSIYQTGAYIADKSMLPLVSVDSLGSIVVIKNASSWRVAERIGKYLSIAGFVGTGLAGFSMKTNEMSEAIYHGTLTSALKLGRVIRQARVNGTDVAFAAAKEAGGILIAQGTVVHKEWEDLEGYLIGYFTIATDEADVGKELRIFFKNENHILWVDGQVKATSPDLIVIIDRQTGQPFTNTYLEVGASVSVIGIPCRPMSRSKRGVEVLGPQNYGFDIPYVPIEERMESLFRIQRSDLYE